MNRVVITGMGSISALGHDCGAMAAGLRLGKSAIGPLGLFPTDELQVKIGAEVRDFDPLVHFDERRLAFLDRCAQFAVVAAREAVAQSGIQFRTEAGIRAAAILGSGVGGMGTTDSSFHRLYREGAKRLAPYTIPRLMISAAVSHVTMDLGISGPSFNIASACSSANHAIGTAFQMIRAGMADVVVTGGTEAVLTFGTMKGWEAMRILAPDTCRPFARGRKGLVIGEGAAVLVLENRDRARSRGASILGEILGYGAGADAGDLIMPSQEGAFAAIRACLEDARLMPDEIEYINAHGTGTKMNDVVETRAIRGIFGPHAERLAVSSTKSMMGHALGAAGALEIVATVLAMAGGFIPPTANYDGADAECDLDYVPNNARPAQFTTALSNAFGFGGLNAILAIGRGS